MRRIHTWTPEHEALLEQYVADLQPLADHYREQPGATVDLWWGAVAGRLAPGVLVTGQACRHRWQVIMDRRRAEAEEAAREAAAADTAATGATLAGPMTWDDLAARVEDYERTVGEATLETVTEVAAVVGQLARATERHTRMLVRLCDAWDVPLPQDGDPT